MAIDARHVRRRNPALRGGVALSLLRLLILLLAFGSAQAHIPLSPDILNDAFEELERARDAADTEATKAAQAEAIYNTALAATELMNLLNQEVQLHGFEQQQLLDEAISVAATLGVEITWSEKHERYFYAGNAYQRYLDVQPNGINAANSRYYLIETGFYLGSTEDRDAIVTRATIENQFLQRYPEFGNAGRVAMFLAIDYRDLWRICNAKKQRECADQYAKLNRDHLAAISVSFEGSRTADLARTFLQRFEAEIANSE